MGELPPGFKFDPFDRELIQFYLHPRVTGSKLQCDIVKERQIYGPNADPWIVFPESDESWMQDSKEEKVMYVFVKLTKKAADPGSGKSKKKKKLESNGREHYERKAGCGTWHGEAKITRIMDERRNVIGEKRMYKFEINEIPQGCSQTDFVVDYYKMHEYSLIGFQDIVLCKITLDPRKKASFNLSKKNQIVDGSSIVGGSSSSSSSSSSMVSVSGFELQQEGGLITSSTSQNFYGICGNEGGLVNNIRLLDYEYRVEDQGSDQGFLGTTVDNFQTSNSDQGSIMNNCSVEIDEGGSRVPEYSEDPFDDDYLMDILANCNEFACYDNEFFNDNQQQPLQAEQQPVQDNNAQRLVEDNVQQPLQDNNAQHLVEDNVHQSMQITRNLVKRKFEGESRPRKRQQYCIF